MLARDGNCLHVESHEGERDHAGIINLLVESVLKKYNWSLDAVDAFAVCNGPGSYTGLRIGLATAKGFAYVLKKPLILNGRLDLLIESLMEQFPDYQNYITVLPARTGEYYAVGRGGDSRFISRHIMLDELKTIIKIGGNNLLISGKIQEDINELLNHHQINFIQQEELNIASWASISYQDFLQKSWADLAYSEPQYLKNVYINKPDASAST